MELITCYLENKPKTYRFWVADKENNIFEPPLLYTEIKRDHDYLNAYDVVIHLTIEITHTLYRELTGWETRYPKLFIENYLDEPLALYELRLRKLEGRGKLTFKAKELNIDGTCKSIPS